MGWSGGEWRHSAHAIKWTKQRTAVLGCPDTSLVNGRAAALTLLTSSVGNYPDQCVGGVEMPRSACQLHPPPRPFLWLPRSGDYRVVRGHGRRSTDASLNNATSPGVDVCQGVLLPLNAISPSVVFTTPGEHLVTPDQRPRKLAQGDLVHPITDRHPDGNARAWSNSNPDYRSTSRHRRRWSPGPAHLTERNGDFTVYDGQGRTGATGRLLLRWALDVTLFCRPGYIVQCSRGDGGRFVTPVDASSNLP